MFLCFKKLQNNAVLFFEKHNKNDFLLKKKGGYLIGKITWSASVESS